jgi:catechol 2,3-dioxygenase-like lactoylglutathione lyase family enzyme
VKRFHVHLHVADVDASVRFYTVLFGVQPTKHKPDYAKWMLDEPCVNFAISKVQNHVGLSHLGFQVENERELGELSAMACEAAGELLVERRVHCGYARGDKSWAEDPQSIRWENFHTYESDLPTFGCGAEESWREDQSGKRTSFSSSCSLGQTND